MKSLIYKYKVESWFVPLLMIYMWILIPVESLLYVDYLASSPLFFLFTGIVYVIESHNNERTHFDCYMKYLPIKRSAYVSFMYIMVIMYEIIMYIVSIFVAKFCPLFMECEPVPKSAPIVLLVSMFIGMIVTGVGIFINFKYSSTKSSVVYYTLCLVIPFILGVITGYTEQKGVSDIDNIINVLSASPAVFAVTLIVEVLIFAFEWVMSIKAYEKKDF